MDNLTHADDTSSILRSNQRPKSHDQAISHFNKLIKKLNRLKSRAISHPIHRLPLELLEYIFHLLLPLESEDETYASPRHEAFPLNLTRVCRQWESLVLSVRNRRLWTTIRIDSADPDWLGRLHVYLFLSRDEGLDIRITNVTQSIADELVKHHRRIHSFLPGAPFCMLTTSESGTVEVVISNQAGKKPFPFLLSSSVKALPFVFPEEGSLHRLQSFPRLQVLKIMTGTLQLHELGSPLQLPALQRLLLVAHEYPLELLKIITPSQLLDLQLELQGPLSPATYHELEAFIIQHMPNLRWFALKVGDYIDSEFVQPVKEEGSITQSSAAKQSESLRRIDLEIVSLSETSVPPFGRLIESAPHLDECHLKTPIQSWPCFSHHIRELELEFRFSCLTILHLMNGEPFKLVHLEVFKLTFSAPEQSQLLTLFQAPSLVSLEVSEIGSDEQDYSIAADVVLAFLSTSQGICHMKLGFPVDSMNLSLPELQNLEVMNTTHIFVLPSFNVPKLQRFFLEIGHRRGEDESIAEDPIGIPSPPLSLEAGGGPMVPDMVNARQTVEMGNEAQRNILEEDENGEDMSWSKETDLYEAPSDPVVTSAPAFPAITFKNVKDFEFEVLRDSLSYPPTLPYFPDILAALPALERVTLPAVSFKVTPYIDQLVNKISKIPTLCPHLQEIRTRDYPNEWSILLKFLRDRKRASLLSDPTLRPIHALHFPITPHGSIVEQLKDAMRGTVSIKSFPALYPWPFPIYPFVVRTVSSLGEVTTEGSDEETRSQVQDGDERTAATRVQAQEEEDTTGNGDEENKSEEGSACGDNEGEALSCFYCHKAGLGAGCRKVFWKQRISSVIEALNGDVKCSRWETGIWDKSRFEAICLP